MKNLFKIYPNVSLGRNYIIGDYVIIGIPLRVAKEGKLKTIIGNDAFFRSHSVIYAGNKIGDSLQTGHSVIIRESNIIGDNVSIGTGTVIEHHIKIGNKVRIHSQAFISEFSVLEDGCWIGPRVVFANTLHPLCPKAKECMKGPIIKKNAKIGANATLLPDIIIGENSLVGAGSVVVGDVPKNSVVIGNPARVIKSIKELKCRYGLLERPYR